MCFTRTCDALVFSFRRRFICVVAAVVRDCCRPVFAGGGGHCEPSFQPFLEPKHLLQYIFVIVAKIRDFVSF